MHLSRSDDNVLKSNCIPLPVLTAHGLGADMGMGGGVQYMNAEIAIFSGLSV